MRKFIYIMAALLTLAACGKKPDNKTELTLEQQLCGEWHSTSLSIEADIYISFAEDKTFEMYQQITEGAHRLYRGTWNLEETLLTGKYNDGEDWAAAYEIVIEGETLTLTSVNDAAEKSVYKKAEIPEDIKTCSAVVVKSAAEHAPVL